MHQHLKQKRIVDTVLTKLALGFNLDQRFSGHHLFPDVNVDGLAGKIIKFGKEAFIIVDSKTAPGATIGSVGFNYSSDVYQLNLRKLAAGAPIEEIQQADNIKILKFKSIAVNNVVRRMRLESENDMALLAKSASSYPAGHTEALTGSSQWDDPTADFYTQMQDAKATVRSKIGVEPNVLHLDYKAYLALKKNDGIREGIHSTNKPINISEAMIAEYLDVEKVVVGKSVSLADSDSDFIDIWQGSSILAYVPKPEMQNKGEPSFGYNYVEEGYPHVGKEYFDEDNDTWKNKVYFRDKAIITYPEAGFLFQNTTS